MALPIYDTIDPQGEYPPTNPNKTISNKVINQNGGEYVKLWFGSDKKHKELESLGKIEDDVCYFVTEDEEE